MRFKKNDFAKILVLGSLLNMVIAPAIYAANQGTISRGSAYAISCLGLVVIGLAVYLSIVILHPERF